MLKKLISYNISTLVMLLLAFTVAYYLLLIEHSFCASISSIIKSCDHSDLLKHLFVVAFLPIYISMIIFGTIFIGLYFGSSIQRLLIKATKPSKS